MDRLIFDDAIYNGIEKIADNYTTEHQENKLIEEMAELMTELAKDIGGNGNQYHIAEETADVLIVLLQVVKKLELADSVKDYLQFKINRQLERIENEKHSADTETVGLRERFGSGDSYSCT